MASGSGVTLDKVTIQIQAGAKDANANIRDLSKTLRELKDATKGGFNNLNKLAKSLSELNKASKNIPNAVENLSNIKKITTSLSKLSEISTPRGLKQAVDNLSKLPAVFNQIDSGVIENVARVSDRLSESLSPLANQLAAISRGMTSLSTMAKTYGISITKVNTGTKRTNGTMMNFDKSVSGLRKGFKFLTNGIIEIDKISSRTFKRMSSKIKQIGLSLLGTRTIFTMTRKAVSEYMAMDVELTKVTQNLWRALGAQLAPAVEYVLYIFKQFVRVVYSIVYALTGIDLIARANAKALASMGKSAKDTLGNLQKFDDLNVAEFNKGSGDDVSKIELEKIDLTPIQKIIDWMKRLKEAIQQAWVDGGWNEVAIVLADGINGVVDYIDPVAIGTSIGDGIITALDFVHTFIVNIDWSELGQKIGDTIRNIPWKEIWDMSVEIAKESLKSLDDFLDGLFDSSSAGETIGGIVLITQLIKGLSGLKLVDVSSDILAGADNAVNKIGSVTKAFKLLSKNTLTVESVSGITGLSKGLTNLLTPLSTISSQVGAMFGTGALGGAAVIIAGIVAAVITLVEAFKNLYNNNEEFRKTFDELISGIKDTGLKIFETLKQTISKVTEVVKDIWKNAIVPLFDLLVSLVEPFLKAAIEILNVLWKNVIAPLADFLMNIFSIAVKVVAGAFKILLDIIKPIISVLQWLWDKILKPIVGFLLDVLAAAIVKVGEDTKKTIAGIKAVVESIWGFVKKIINLILGGVEGFINAIIKGLNWLIKQINKISFDVPDWVPDIGGKTLGFNLALVGEVSLPRLETGTNEVPYEGIYHLHPGEAVVPKKYNPALGNGTNEETNEKLDTLINIMQNMNFTNVVNVGNETLYKKQQSYNKKQNDKYGTTVNL